MPLALALRVSSAWQSVLLLSVASMIIISMALVPSAKAEQVSAWTPIANYPPTLDFDSFPKNGSLGISSTSCASSDGYVYCIGGKDSYGSTNNTVYADITDLGVKPWGIGTQYPLVISGDTCVTSDGYIYCVGGEGEFGNATAAAYYATISSSGIGKWTATTAYPAAASSLSCVASTGFVYCLGGAQLSAGPEPSYYAPLSGSGLGPWQSTAGYPGFVQGQACAAANSTIYCVGGRMPDGYPNNATEYARLSSSGFGAWQAGPDYPFSVSSQSCVTLSGYLYCIGGQKDVSGGPGVTITDANASAYFAALSGSGMGGWEKTTSYPVRVFDEACVASSYIYCIGGLVNNSATASSGVYTSGPPPTVTVTNTGTPTGLTSTSTVVITQTGQSVTSYAVNSTSSNNGSLKIETGYIVEGAIALIPILILLLIFAAVTRRRRPPGPDGKRRGSNAGAAILLCLLIVVSLGVGAYLAYPANVKITAVTVQASYFQGTYIFNPVTPTYFDQSQMTYPTDVTANSNDPVSIQFVVINNDSAPHYIFDVRTLQSSKVITVGDVDGIVACEGCFSTAGNATLVSDGDNYGVPAHSNVTLTVQVQICAAGGSYNLFNRCLSSYTGPVTLVVSSPS